MSGGSHPFPGTWLLQSQRLDGTGFRMLKFWDRIPVPKVLGPDSGPKNCYYNLSPKKITHLYSMLLFS